ncbi:rRNA small subunit methyltransferase B [Cellulomonas sp. H30R-01]|uniref:RsmB/NOP family class I SAM-dependent RNA methyltransferase n=1 Tax=Cellulomonas sp. H30R-01 TaxID=2704467 RepID=UPI00138C950F|nr:transcription antitermination factor NusB [Cellulomonas sp. H30R-01]QHT55802.1 rRNA small subunit methyltransferase B [Cellulomonas sp. H30R-01]
MSPDDRPDRGRAQDGRGGDGRAGRGRGDGGDGRDAQGRQRGAARREGRSTRTTAAPSQRRRGTDPARRVAYDVLRTVAESDAYANLVLPPLLRERGLTGRDAAFTTELTYGTLRLRGRYDAILELAAARTTAQIDAPALDVLRLGAHQLLGMRVPPHAAVSETVGLARDALGAGPAQFVNAVLRAVSREPWDAWEQRIADAAGEDPVARLAVVGSHPLWVARALREALAGDARPVDELGALLDADNTPPLVTLVARPGLSDVDELGGATADRPGTLSPTAVVLAGGDPASVPAVRDGRAGVQDDGSQLVALALAAAPLEGRDERWLDLCAGPGGKAALLAAEAAGRGARLVANELQPHRARLVRQSLRAVPPSAVEVVRTGDGRVLGDDEPGAFDRVMVDAPCTGLGALRRRPESRWRRTPADLTTLTGLQRDLLGSALRAVRVGGVVAYVTCSPHLAETRLVVKDALRAAAKAGIGVERIDTAAVVQGVARREVELTDRSHVQLWPHVHGTDAMHLTLLRRTS